MEAGSRGVFSLTGGVHPSLSGLSEQKTEQETLYSRDETASLRSWLDESEESAEQPDAKEMRPEPVLSSNSLPEDEQEVLLDLLADECALFSAVSAPSVPKRLSGVCYFGRRLTEWHESNWQVYECKQCNTPIVLKEIGGEEPGLSAPSHGDALEGHCRVCFETSKRKRTKRADYPRKFCGRCAAWVDSTHWQRHLHSRGHSDCGSGTDAPREVDWDESRRWKLNRSTNCDQGKPAGPATNATATRGLVVAGTAPTTAKTEKLSVAPQHVFWASEVVELDVTVPEELVAEGCSIGDDTRLVVSVPNARPGFAVALLRQIRGRELSFWGFNAEFGIFNGTEPDGESVQATVRLEQPSKKQKCCSGEFVFYKTPRRAREVVKQQLRLVSRKYSSAATSLDAQRAWFPLLPARGDAELEGVAGDCGFEYMRHELARRRYEETVFELGLPKGVSQLVLECLGCNFALPIKWAARKIAVVVKRRARDNKRHKAASVVCKCIATPKLRLFAAKSLRGLLISTKCYGHGPGADDWNEALGRFLVKGNRVCGGKAVVPRDPDTIARLALACRLSAPQLVNVLVGGLPSSSEALALVAAYGNDDYRDIIFEIPEAVSKLSQSLKSRERGPAAARCLAALARSSALKDGLGQQCIPALCASLKDASVAPAALVALGDLCKDREGNSSLALETDPCRDLVALLPKCRLPATTVILTLCGTGDAEKQVNLFAVREFGKTPDTFRNLEPLLYDKDVKDLAAKTVARLCWDDSNKSKVPLARLCSMKTPHAVLAVRNVAFALPDAVLEQSDSVSNLIFFANGPNKRVAAWATQAIAHVAQAKNKEPLKALVPTLVKLLDHPTKLVRIEAARALNILNNNAPKLRPILAEHLLTTSPAAQPTSSTQKTSTSSSTTSHATTFLRFFSRGGATTTTTASSSPSSSNTSGSSSRTATRISQAIQARSDVKSSS